MNADEQQKSAEGLRIKYAGGNILWVDGVVLFSASAVALLVACWLISMGISAATVSRAMAWLAVPWFVALYFLCRKLRKVAAGGFEIVLNFGAVPTYATAIVMVIVIYRFADVLGTTWFRGLF
jgi:hypothetical protein